MSNGRFGSGAAGLDAMRRALQRGDGWALDDDRIKASKDLDAANLQPTVTGFLAGAAEGETLLVYFAGHGLDQRPAARPEVFEPGPWKSGQVQRLGVPLKDLEPGDYRVEVEPCRAGTERGHEPPSTFRIRLGG
jgi:hypothetical protein